MCEYNVIGWGKRRCIQQLNSGVLRIANTGISQHSKLLKLDMPTRGTTTMPTLGIGCKLSAVRMKPQDILVLLKLSSLPLAEWSYQQLGEALCMSASEVHAALTRARASRLVDAADHAVTIEVRLLH